MISEGLTKSVPKAAWEKREKITYNEQQKKKVEEEEGRKGKKKSKFYEYKVHNDSILPVLIKYC